MENGPDSAPVPVSRGVPIADISLLVIGFLAGTFGNGRACLLLRRRRDLRRTPHFLFANLSVIGFLSSLVSIFGWLVMIAMSQVFISECSKRVMFYYNPVCHRLYHNQCNDTFANGN